MISLASLLQRALLWAHLLACPDSPSDPGGVQCASVQATRVTPPWRNGADAGAAFLRATARAESNSSPIGVHAGDAHVGAKMWAGAVRAGWLTPATCPGHHFAAGGRRGRAWAPTQAWGVSAAYSLRHLGWIGCWFGPAALQSTPLAAVAAAGHLRHCARVRRTRNPDEIRVCWAGSHKARADVLRRWRDKP